MDYMHRINVLDSPKPEWFEILFHTITGIIGGCSAALPIAIRHKEFALYVLAAYGAVGGISALVGGVAMYAFFPYMPQIGLRAFAFAGALSMAVPIVLLIARAVIHIHIKTKVGEISVDLSEDEHRPG